MSVMKHFLFYELLDSRNVLAIPSSCDASHSFTDDGIIDGSISGRNARAKQVIGIASINPGLRNFGTVGKYSR